MQHKLTDQIKQIFQTQPVSVLDCGVYQEDFQSMKDYQWYKSGSITLMNAILKKQYQQLFYEDSSQSTSPFKLKPCKIIDPFTTTMIIFMGEQPGILQSLEPMNLFSYRYLLIPCNTDTNYSGKGNHWFLMLYDTLQNSMYTMDSSYECVHKNAHTMGKRLQQMRKMFKVQEKFSQQYQRILIQMKGNQKQMKKKLNFTKQFRVQWLKNIVRQKNNYDCGVYTIGNIERVLKQLKLKLNNKIDKQISSVQQIEEQLNNFKIEPEKLQVNEEQFKGLRMKYFCQALQMLKISKKIK